MLKEIPKQFNNGTYECNIGSLQLIEDTTKHDDTYRFFKFKVSLVDELIVEIL